MALSIGELTGYVDLDTKGLTKGVSQVDSSLGKTRSGFSSLAKFAAGAFAAVGAVDFFKDAFGEAEEAQKVGAQTAAVIKSTGGAAKVTAAQVGALAAKISTKTGIDDEAIQTGQNMLLTFKNLRNEQGKGNDMFNQATKSMVDMSAAMGTDAKSSAIMLGKALNDPTKGLSAMSRVGITFSDSQEKSIKSMQKHGNMMGAQKIILKELASEFGGSAEAIATPADKAKVAWGNFKEQIGTAVMPVVAALANFATTKLIPAASQLAAKLATVGPAIKAFVQGFKEGTGAGGQLRTVLTSIAQSIGAVVSWAIKWQDVLVPVAAGVLAVVAAIKVWTTVTAAYTAVQAALNVALAANPIGLVVLAIVGLVAAFVVAYKKSETFRKVVQGALGGVKKAAVAVGNFFVKTLPRFFASAWNKITSGARAVGNFFTRTVPQFFSNAWNKVKSVTGSAVSRLVGFVKSLPGRYVAVLRSLAGILANVAQAAWARFRENTARGVSVVLGFVQSIPGKIKNALGNLGNLLLSVGGDVVSGLVRGISGAAHRVYDAAMNLVSKIPGPIRKVMGIASPSKVTKKIGNQIGDGLAKGMDERAKDAREAAQRMAKAVAERLKERRQDVREAAQELAQAAIDGAKSRLDGMRSVLATVKSNMASIASTVADAFRPDLFGQADVSSYLSVGADSIKQLKQLTAARKALVNMGGSKDFLTQLFSSGNSNLIMELAGGKKSTLKAAQQTYAYSNYQTSRLGNQVGQAQLGGKVDKVTAELRELRRDLREVERRRHRMAGITVHQRRGESVNELAERLWFKTRTRG